MRWQTITPDGTPGLLCQSSLDLRQMAIFLADVQRNRVDTDGLIFTVVSEPSLRWREPPCACDIKPRRGPPGYRTSDKERRSA
jgi:hypothetical protein